MPIHQHPEQHFPKFYKQGDVSQRHVNARRLSEESIRTEYCDGPISDIPAEDVALQTAGEGRVSKNGEAICSDRAELIERIKRGESPTWIPNQAVSQGWSSLRNTHSGSLGTNWLYVAMVFASQRRNDALIVSLCLLQGCTKVNEETLSTSRRSWPS